MKIPEELEYALETVEPEERQELLEKWANLTEDERKFVLMAIGLDACQEYFYNKRRNSLGLD